MKKMNKLCVLMLPCLLMACSKIDDPSLQPRFNAAEAIAPQPVSIAPYDQNRRVFFGDLHIHTSLSSDAFVMGSRTLPEDVYRYAKGFAIEHGAGYPIQISEPLDFVAVTDHAEYLGHARLSEIEVPSTERPLRETLTEGNAFTITLAWLRTTLGFRKSGWAVGYEEMDPSIMQSAWRQTIDAAERHNQPGAFTTFIGYEWSASVGDLATHIHRNVIYKGSDVSDKPFSSLDSDKPEDLWKFLLDEQRQGRVAMAIPHNANFSLGNMYASNDSFGRPLTPEYAQIRNQVERLSEILQIKGASETHPILSNLDEFADYGIAQMVPGKQPPTESLSGSYARDALLRGLEFKKRDGFNPFRFGVIGASDSHNASSPAEESNFTGKLPMMDGSAGLRISEAMLLPANRNPVTTWSSGGLAGVWAEENTRASLFSALHRRETYATSGPRLSLRMFGGWGFESSIIDSPDVIQQAYAQGVPMGGTLSSASNPTFNSLGGDAAADAVFAPRFLIFSAKDPKGANLDRLQVVKGWVDADGNSREKIYDVALANNRATTQAPGEPGDQVPSVGSTVDINAATYTNSIGDAQLNTWWQDPDFDPSVQSFYYARVLEIPTPRWSTYDAVALGVKPMQPETIQERAIGSAIWYEPD